MDFAEKVESVFRKNFNKEPLIIRSPGRVNLIGEHTDYNMGFVLPAAISKSVYFAIGISNNSHCRLIALDMNDSYEFEIENLQRSKKVWPNYLMGIIDQFLKSGYKLGGVNCVFSGDVPIGAGMSSSAALGAGFAFALNEVYQLGVSNIDLVKLSQKSENEFVGLKCGIMDQYINIFGRPDSVLKIDCRTLEHKYYPFKFSDVSIVLFDTCVSRSLASSEYNKRRAECNEGVAIISKKYQDVKSLRDVTIEMLEENKSLMSETVYKRCKYVIEENNRVLLACSALESMDLKQFGIYMNESHIGLSKKYEVSCNELDYLYELVVDKSCVYGSRMMGAGFGGCTINLIKNDCIEEISNLVKEKYKQRFGREPKVYITSIGSGTQVIKG